jgi:uncharacterized coiled-coil protein SlyX
MAMTFLTIGYAADDPANKTASSAELAKLKAQLEQQQKQIEQLSAMLAAQTKMLEQLTGSVAAAPAPAPAPAAPPAHMLPNLGEVASITPMIPTAPATPLPSINPPAPQPAAAATTPAPLQLQLGNITITPIGFLDAAGVWRSKNAGSGIGSNFGSIPFDNSVPGGKLNEFRFSPQNSRVGFRIDGNWKGIKFLNYLETDFLGTSGANNIGITNGAFVPRLRLFWLSMRKGPWEVLGGQSWSMFTPNRKGISALPGDIFYGQEFDVNYLIGLPWTRQPGFRVLFHGPGDKVTFGLSAENPNQYMGGYGGGGQIVLPSALTGLAGTQIDNGSTSPLSTPNPAPDIIAKLAFDPSSRAHVEIGGIQRTFKLFNTTTGQPTSGQTFTKSGGGGEVNANFEVSKGVRLIANNQFGDGIGRYFFGNAPDFVVRADGSISPVHTFTTTDGLEYTIKNTLLYFYFGGIYIGKNVAIDANGTSLVGWGYTGSSNGQNRSVNEYTFGLNQTLWKSPAYGAVNFMLEYEYATRTPWYVATGALDHAADHTVYVDLRYTLPGSAPSAK